MLCMMSELMLNMSPIQCHTRIMSLQHAWQPAGQLIVMHGVQTHFTTTVHGLHALSIMDIVSLISLDVKPGAKPSIGNSVHCKMDGSERFSFQFYDVLWSSTMLTLNAGLPQFAVSRTVLRKCSIMWVCTHANATPRLCTAFLAGRCRSARPIGQHLNSLKAQTRRQLLPWSYFGATSRSSPTLRKPKRSVSDVFYEAFRAVREICHRCHVAKMPEGERSLQIGGGQYPSWTMLYCERVQPRTWKGCSRTAHRNAGTYHTRL